ncbi:MAG: hypothetical protein ABIQ72_07465 [Usitatibacter sp.]
MDCWHREIEQANTEAEVASRASDYLALWAPRELEPLTLGWREMRMETADDVRAVKTWLLDSPATSDPAAELHDLAGYFWHAVERIDRIRSAPH